ncbi:MAG TPA: DNA repair protein RecN [Lachnospiraceae bacterium]|nr:DNA repair protein RecN [Lachnospiraceae bacterium]
MLINIHVKNLALIDELDIEFGRGLSILTGETGAGKSIIIGAIGIGLGGRFSRELLRDREKDGLVELTFNLSGEKEDIVPEEYIEDGQIIISRKLSGERVINRINGETVTAGKIREIAERLINLHAQHEQTTLLREEMHIEILDSSDKALAELKDKVAKDYREYTANHNELAGMTEDASERIKRADYLSYEVKEIEEASLVPGEDEELEKLYQKMNNSREIREITEEVYGITGYDSSSSAGNSFSRAVQRLRTLERLDKDADPLISQITDIDSLISDFNHALSEYINEADFDEETYSMTEKRLDLINSLKAKYGRTIDDILKSCDEMKAELEKLLGYDERVKELTEKDKVLYEKLEASSEKLSKARIKQAEVLCTNISAALAQLNFNKVEFYMDISRLDRISASGRDRAVFMISTNVGEAAKPLHMVASGGELSRIMLAIKSCLADADSTPTLIFDEVDVGISGITAQKVAEMMKKLSESHQIISITHLPQIASKADTNYLIEKVVRDEKTYSGIRRIDGDEKIHEIARLLGGETITDNVISAARELLAQN